MKMSRSLRTVAILTASMFGSVCSVSCRARAMDALDQAVIDYVYSLIDPNNLVDLFEIPAGDDN